MYFGDTLGLQMKDSMVRTHAWHTVGSASLTVNLTKWGRVCAN